MEVCVLLGEVSCRLVAVELRWCCSVVFCLPGGISHLKRDFSFCNRRLEFLTLELMSKLSIRRYVWVSLRCHLYSSVNHEMGTSAYPMFLSVFVRIMSVLVCSLCICSVDMML